MLMFDQARLGEKLLLLLTEATNRKYLEWKVAGFSPAEMRTILAREGPTTYTVYLNDRYLKVSDYDAGELFRITEGHMKLRFQNLVAAIVADRCLKNRLANECSQEINHIQSVVDKIAKNSKRKIQNKSR